MEERKVVNNWHLGDVGLAGFMSLFLIAGAVLVLVIGVAQGNRIAIFIAGIVIATILIFLGVFLALLIMAKVHKHEQKRAEVEQARFRDNTTENLAHLEQQARAQLAQARAQDQQWKVARTEVDTYRKMITGGNETAPTGIVFDNVDFSDLED